MWWSWPIRAASRRDDRWCWWCPTRTEWRSTSCSRCADDADGVHLERRVSRLVARIGVGAVVDQVVEMVGEAELARVMKLLSVVSVLEADGRAVEEQVLDALHRGAVQDGQVERRECARVHHFGERAQLEQCRCQWLPPC